jgi:hypothetical protein
MVMKISLAIHKFNLAKVFYKCHGFSGEKWWGMLGSGITVWFYMVFIWVFLC